MPKDHHNGGLGVSSCREDRTLIACKLPAAVRRESVSRLAWRHGPSSLWDRTSAWGFWMVAPTNDPRRSGRGEAKVKDGAPCVEVLTVLAESALGGSGLTDLQFADGSCLRARVGLGESELEFFFYHPETGAPLEVCLPNVRSARLVEEQAERSPSTALKRAVLPVSAVRGGRRERSDDPDEGTPLQGAFEIPPQLQDLYAAFGGERVIANAVVQLHSGEVYEGSVALHQLGTHKIHIINPAFEISEIFSLHECASIVPS